MPAVGQSRLTEGLKPPPLVPMADRMAADATLDMDRANDQLTRKLAQVNGFSADAVAPAAAAPAAA